MRIHCLFLFLLIPICLLAQPASQVIFPTDNLFFSHSPDTTISKIEVNADTLMISRYSVTSTGMRIMTNPPQDEITTTEYKDRLIYAIKGKRMIFIRKEIGQLTYENKEKICIETTAVWKFQ